MENLKPMTTTDPGHDIAISRATEALDEEPDERQISHWIDTTLKSLELGAKEVSVRIVGSDEIMQLNADYRGKPKPTNVLSFPANLELDGIEMLGDIVICSEVVRQEAADYDLSFSDRYAHMLVHGLLHLLGYDHEADEARRLMESMERNILASLDMPDPYMAGEFLIEDKTL